MTDTKSPHTDEDLTSNMWAALRQIERDGSYSEFIPSCRALERRGLLRWDASMPPFQSWVLTTSGQALLADYIAEQTCLDCDGDGCSTCDGTGRTANLCIGADEEGIR